MNCSFFPPVRAALLGAALVSLTATAPSAPVGKVRARGDRPMVSYRGAAFYVCQPLDIDRPLRLDLPRRSGFLRGQRPEIFCYGGSMKPLYPGLIGQLGVANWQSRYRLQKSRE